MGLALRAAEGGEGVHVSVEQAELLVLKGEVVGIADRVRDAELLSEQWEINNSEWVKRQLAG